MDCWLLSPIAWKNWNFISIPILLLTRPIGSQNLDWLVFQTTNCFSGQQENVFVYLYPLQKQSTWLYQNAALIFKTCKPSIWIKTVNGNASPFFYIYNTTAKTWAGNSLSMINFKHIDTRYHFLKDMEIQNSVKILNTNSENNLADFSTRALDRILFNNSWDLLGMKKNHCTKLGRVFNYIVDIFLANMSAACFATIYEYYAGKKTMFFSKLRYCTDSECFFAKT